MEKWIVGINENQTVECIVTYEVSPEHILNIIIILFVGIWKTQSWTNRLRSPTGSILHG